MDNSLPPADELVLVDRELAQLEARRTQLLARRAWLVQVLYRPARAATPRWPVTPAAPAADSTPRSAQNVLLTLGGTLLTIAAVAFTLVSWGSMGIGGRAAVLCAVTGAALSAPVVLLRRGLVSTGESVAVLGLVLTVLDAYALHRVALSDTDGLGYAAVASAVLAGAWAAYGSALPRLRVPLPAGVVAAQLPLPLGVLAAGGGATAFAWAALVTAAADGAVVLWTRPLPVRITAGAGAALLGGWALLTGGWLSVSSPWSGAPLLLAGAAVYLYAAWRTSGWAVAASVVAGLAVVAAVGGLLRSAVPGDWAVPGYVLCGLALAAVWRAGAGARLPRGVRTGLAGAGAATVALGLLWALPPVAGGALGPLARTTEVWSGEHTRPALVAYPATAALVLAVVAAALASVPRLWARCGALALVWALLTALPVAPGLPYAATLALQLLTTAAALWIAVRPAPLTRGLPRPGATPTASPEARTTADRTTDPTNRPATAATGPSGASATGPAEPPASGPSAPGPTDRTAAEPAGTPVADPAAPSASGPAGRPTPGPVGTPVAGPAASPASGPSAPGPAGRPASGPAGQSASGPAGQSAGGSVPPPPSAPPRVPGAGFGAPGTGWMPPRPRPQASAAEPGTVLGWVAYAGGLVSAAGAVALALDVRGATFLALGAVLGLLTGVAVLGTGARRTVSACGAVLAAAGLVFAGAAAAGLEAHWTGLALLLVPAATAAVGATARPVALPVEITGAAVGLSALGLAASRPAFLALVLALGGVIAAATAVRPERRRFASWAAAGLFLLAAWVRLGAWGVTTPEAYTLPVTVPALVVGFLRRRRDPEASSWTAYGPGLAVTLLPSLGAAWTDPEWVRPLVLGVAALVVTLFGARFRLQALLLLGGTVLALDGLHELAPYVVQVVGALPRWLPPALAGLLLLAVGATYEQRLRDARRLRERLARMR
ncbi:SCO7613 C-terminal domain-containing membrane protein [Streptomyces cinereoruber]|uniref:SCO7613 C-terminal domain-containing membrane protein n=1 Tax=Streptomyces cinereoruber TaxID=67260 RepID=UPI003BF55680